MTTGELSQPQQALIQDLAQGRRTARFALQDELLAAWEAHDDALDPMLDQVASLASDGSEEALELILTAVHQLGLARPAITRLVIDPETVADISQRALMKVEANLRDFEGRSKFRTWLFTIARNEALMHLRRRSESEEPDDLESLPDGAVRMSTVIATRATVREAVEALADPYRETMLLRMDDDLEYDEIADRLDVPVGTVRSRLAKARELVAEALAA